MENFGVYPRLDYFTAVFNNVDVAYVLEFMGLAPTKFGEYLTDSYMQNQGYQTRYIYKFENIKIDTRVDDIVSSNIDDDFINIIFSDIRLEISGKGLDYLRSKGIDVEHRFRRQPDVNELTGRPVFHPTRADFAFDLVNYASDFLDKCLDHVSKYSNRVPLCGKKGGITFSVRTGDQKTLYLGSPSSDKLLRIYDKKWENSDRYGMLKWSPVDYDVDSWIRVEFQTRDKDAARMLYGEGDYLSIFRFIFDNFSFKSEEGGVSQFWVDLFDWEKIPAIIQNAKWVSTPLDKEKCDTLFVRALKVVCAYEAVYGLNYVEKRKREFMDDIYSPGMQQSYKRKSFERIIDCLLDWSHDFKSCIGAFIMPTKNGQILKLRGYDRK